MTTLMKPHVIPTKERIYMDHATYYGLDCIKRHIARYKWASTKLKQTDIVMDGGCGSGYGSVILLNSCARVVGVDSSLEAINYAQWKADHLRWDRVEYHRDDLSDLLVSEFFDAIVCVEVIEHLEQEAQIMFMRSLPHILTPGGRFILTTPAKAEGDTTDYHRHEFKRDEFTRFLHRYFCYIHFDDPLDFGIPSNFILACCSGLIQ